MIHLNLLNQKESNHLPVLFNIFWPNRRKSKMRAVLLPNCFQAMFEQRLNTSSKIENISMYANACSWHSMEN